MKQRLSLLAVLLLTFCVQGRAQQAALKTNVLADAAAVLNAGAEFGLAPRWTLDLNADYNALSMPDDRRWRHLSAQPELRYWFCERFGGHFIGLHVHGGIYNFGKIENAVDFLGTDWSLLTDERFQGWFVGAGLGYGYAWILGKHWNLEFEAGFGYSYTRYDRYPCAVCGDKIQEDAPHHYIGPTKLALNLIYLF